MNVVDDELGYPTVGYERTDRGRSIIGVKRAREKMKSSPRYKIGYNVDQKFKNNYDKCEMKRWKKINTNFPFVLYNFYLLHYIYIYRSLKENTKSFFVEVKSLCTNKNSSFLNFSDLINFFSILAVFLRLIDFLSV